MVHEPSILVFHLLALQTYVCGTIKEIYAPENVRFSNSEARTISIGQYRTSVREGKVPAIGWKDQKPVYVLSSVDHNKISVTQLCTRRIGSNQTIEVVRPADIGGYNGNMGKVDEVDQ
jgi:hypothetical protein